MANRLGDATSDYLLQHAHQPVDWWQWGPEALAHAAETGRPIMLSVGYASCHWCHVMSDESFENAEIAAQINENFVPVKVDRQQHPDVDAVYMAATQALNNGSGGWPMTAFLTPDGKPFFTGTYFPPEPRDGMPSFPQVLDALATAWAERRDEVVGSADVIAQQLAGSSEPEPPSQAPDLRDAVDTIGADFDVIHGGFGNAPKFPTATVLDALLVKGDPKSLDMAQRTLESMARGGIHDQVGGGFHRYSVDAGWVVPHFEKMLDDNAVLLRAYVRGWRRTADHDTALRALFERTAYGIVSWLVHEMRTESGAFAAALDADSTDIRGMTFEGVFYLWNQEVLTDVLGEELGGWAADTFHVTAGGTFSDGLSVLQLRGRPDPDKLDDVRAKLLAERASRFRPATDRLVVAGWNGLAISALADAAMVFNEPRWLEIALEAAQYLVDVHLADGDLRRSSLEGVADSAGGSAEDHGAVAEAFAVLAGITGDATWLRRAEGLVERALELFGAPDGGFFDSAASDLFDRPRSLTDHVSPSGTSALVSALRQVGLLAEREDLLARAEEAARTTWATVARAPRFAGSALSDLMVSDEARRGLKRATVVVSSEDPFDELARAVWRMAPAGSAILRAAPGTEGWGSLLQGRSERAVYVCRGTVCFDPVADYNELRTPLWRRA
ncbi:thioredoxin domain-containing protein [Tessaracoccus rhinocerotis]|uniref:Thioredoxin domain-containing protein n=1 Tax=Tessaracoccus rhinocerotis TaxID=1689449 RepID=A0A553K1Z6_9ACTN|nr:thioredoxin domain-containing protein [Tessaracoccus rhinocerotis]TRY18705.1 thioredoxin domain-containing protein [Tessaracoccus rhinocerotis]